MPGTDMRPVPQDVVSYGEFRYAAWSPRFMAASSVICLAIVIHLSRFAYASWLKGFGPDNSLTEFLLVAAYALVLLGASLYMAITAASRLRFFLRLGRDGFETPAGKVSWSEVRNVDFQVIRLKGRGRERIRIVYAAPATGKERTVSVDWVLAGWSEVKEILARENRKAASAA